MKPADVCPAATVRLAGTVRLALLLASGTVNPPDGAADVKVTVQGVLPGVAIVRFVQFTALTPDATVGTEIEPDPPLAAIDEPPSLAPTTPVI